METLEAVWPQLTEEQRRVVVNVALALASSEAHESGEWLTVRQIVAQYPGKCTRSGVSAAMAEGRLEFSTPTGQTRPRYSRRADVERWLGIGA